MISNTNNIFEFRPIYLPKDKITALDSISNTLFLGDQSGSLRRLSLPPSSLLPPSSSSLPLSSSIPPPDSDLIERLSKSRIDSIKCPASLDSLILVLNEGNLLQVSSKNLARARDPIAKNIAIFAVNEHFKCLDEVVVVSKKKEGFIFKFDPKQGRFVQQMMTFSVPEVPVCLIWVEKLIYVAYNKKEYGIINSDDFGVTSLNIPIAPSPFIRMTNYDEILVLTNNNVGIFLGLDGQMKQKSTLSVSQRPIISMTTLENYLLVLLDNQIQVFNLIDAKLLQEISFGPNSQAKCLSASSSPLFFGTQSEIHYLYLTPYKTRIRNCLLQGRVEEAFAIYYQRLKEEDGGRKEGGGRKKEGEVGRREDEEIKLEQLKTDAVWVYLRELKFEGARREILEVSFDVRELMVLFPEYISTTRKNFLEGKKYMTMSAILNDILQEKISGANKKEELVRESQRYLKLAKDFLRDVLENRRAYYLSNNASNLKENLIFLPSPHNFNTFKLSQTTIEELLEQIDFVLIKIYCEFALHDKLKSFFTNNKVFCRAMMGELEPTILQFKNTNASIVAKFYENFGKIKECLEHFKILAKTDLKISEEACEETVKVLKDCKDRKLVSDTLKWLLPKNLYIGAKSFSVISEEVITPDQMLGFLSEFEDPQLSLSAKEKYLEVLVNEKKIEEERFHTNLAIHYIDCIFKKLNKDSQIDISTNLDTKTLNYLKKLAEFLRAPYSKYRSLTLLEKIKDSFLLEDEIFLYGRDKQHKKALSKLVKERKYEMAENYCIERSENLLSELFILYINLLKPIEEVINNSPNDSKAESKYREVKNCINNFLKKYSTHSELDPLTVLEKLPEWWKLEEKREGSVEDGLHAFLSNILSHTLNQKRNMKVAKHLSEMDLVNSDFNLAKTKKANIKITSEKNCSVCHRRIGDKVFVVYPNGVVAHHTCISNKAQSICPVTGQNFEKNYKD